LLSSAPVFAGSAKEHGIAYPLQYEGGSLPLKQNASVKAVAATGELVFVQHGQRFVVPATSISEIAHGIDVRRRFGATVLGLVPFLDLDRVEEYYISLTWSAEARSNRTVLFKLNRGEYREFLVALERLTGKKAVDTKKTATTVRYDL
jgi:hypothetical protein